MELILTSWVAFMGGLWVLFSGSEKVASPDAKKAITRWLKNLKVEGALENWPSTFAGIFDTIFGKKHFSWHCFWRSSIGSFVAVLIVTLLWSGLRPAEFNAFIESSESWYMHVFNFFVFTVLLNLIPDYISLLQSRYIIRCMSTRASTGRVLRFLAMDFVATFAIASGAFVTVLSILFYVFGNAVEESVWHSLRHKVFTLSAVGSGAPSLGIFFYSTFFTSVWVWLYALSGLAVKVGEYFGITVSRIRWFLDIENKPLHSLGVISMLLVTMIYLGVGFYRLVGSS